MMPMPAGVPLPHPALGMGYGVPNPHVFPPMTAMAPPTGFQPAFPAYQEEFLPSQAPGSPQSAKPHYIYPDEDLSMEEKRALLEKYKYKPEQNSDETHQEITG